MLNNQTTKLANLSAIDEQLFTEITPEQAAIVEGGLQRISLGILRSIRSGADSDGSDEVYATFNGQVPLGTRTQSMRTGSVANFTAGSNVSGSSVTVSLFDQDGIRPNPANDDFLGSFRVSRPGSGERRVSGSGSEYTVTFSAF
jgi:hypothetical protein